MTTTPTIITDPPTQEGDNHRAALIQVDTALESMRDSGFDLTAAAGEPIDNSVESGADLIRVVTTHSGDKSVIEEIAFADNGRGIDPKIHPNVLSMGFSSRYGSRSGLGRFGVGLKLAGLSLGRRIDMFSKLLDEDTIRHSYIDLDEIRDGQQVYIEVERQAAWPERYAELVRDSNGTEFNSGTLVIFGKIDRLQSGGTYGTSLDEKKSDLRSFIARAYRKFLDNGLVIELNGTPVTLLDPLFLMDNPRIIKRYKPLDIRGTVVDEDDIDIDGHKVHVTVSLVPEEFRPVSQAGGSKDSQGRDIREFQIPERAGKISMVRNGREINYDLVAKLLPGGTEKVDRYIGIEVTFPAELDEYFQVRNVKRGAVPVNKLREELRSWLVRPVRQARSEIRRHWNEVETKERADSENEHEAATDAVNRAEQTAPQGRAGQGVSEAEEDQVIDDVIEDLQLDPNADAERAATIRQRIKSTPITIVDLSWPGKELFEINHLNGKAILRLNHRHPFIRDVYDPLKKVATDGGEGLTPEEMIDLARRTETALDILFLAYAKAENMHQDPSMFDDLRSYWGQFTQAYLKEVSEPNS
ncbi:MAG: ATP-binding protein [Actinomycetota bacterium]|jgi:hypothetical protein|nr:ATP-binding protein [Actinomycetota bacterium]MDA8357553.1 ATP-binding protein [Actinomycetota bacterium]